MILTEQAEESVRELKARNAKIPNEYQLFSDLKHYSEELLWIRNKKGMTVPFRWNIVQSLLHERLNALSEQHRRLRLILKYRRAGITTYMQAKSFFKAANNEGQYCATLAHDNLSTAKIFDISLMFYSHLPAWATPSRKTENRKELNFHKLGSVFYIGTAGGHSFGRGQTVQRVHGSEIAFWPKSADVPSLVAGIMEAASHGEVDFETTANGHGNWFHKAWNDAKSGLNAWVPIFLSWKDDPELQIPTEMKHDAMRYTTEEEILVKAYSLTPSQILWRRMKQRELYDADSGSALFKQEYPINDIEAFISTGLAFFDVELVSNLPALCKDPIQLSDSGRLKVWVEPVEYRSYVVAADIGEGVAGGNRTVIVVMDIGSCEEVCSWAGVTSPEDAGRKMADLGYLYNNALLAPEANNFGHSTLNTLLNEINYPAIYEMEDYAKIFVEKDGLFVQPRFGWQTNGKTRPLMLSEFRYALQNGLYHPNDKELISECMTFIDNGHGKFEAAKDSYDDRVFAHSIVWQVRKRALEFGQIDHFAIDTGFKSISNGFD